MSSNTDGISLNGFTTQVILWTGEGPTPWWIWRLVPVKVEGVSTPSQPSSEALGSGFPPSYSGDTIGQSSTHVQHVESEHDEFGTIVSEVTVVTTTSTSTVTTRKRY